MLLDQQPSGLDGDSQTERCVSHSVPSAWLPLSVWALLVHCRRISRQVKGALADWSRISSTRPQSLCEHYKLMCEWVSDQQVSSTEERVCMRRVAQALTCPRSSFRLGGKMFTELHHSSESFQLHLEFSILLSFSIWVLFPFTHTHALPCCSL